ncbi:MAG TPA: hypothetical protein VJ852_00405 [Gemmatimonadaceae bacterium]|nr:hypothetical protein [Gemmatimonadaceae bacterium]
MKTLSLIGVSLVIASGTATAQGALSLQGLGYPAGGISTRSEGAGSSLADFDALSVTTPAAIAGVGSSAIYFQYSPEFRRVTTAGGTAKTTTARFPVVLGVLPMGQTWTLGLSSSTFLDRSLETSLSRTEVVGDATDTVTVTERNKVLGAINDVRLALAWSRSPVFRFGVGGHVFSGSNRITLSTLYPDSSKYISTSQVGRVSYAGFAASVGLEYRPSRAIGFALSARKGGDLRAESGDTTLGTGRLPDHFSGSITYEGLPGTIISGRLAHDSWSSLGSLSATGIQAFDGWDGGVGIEATGPRLMQRVIAIRAGARFRTLPFGAPNVVQTCVPSGFCSDVTESHRVSERSFAAGLGIPLTRNRAALDVSFERATRDANSAVKERGFILSFGLRVSP